MIVKKGPCRKFNSPQPNSWNTVFQVGHEQIPVQRYWLVNCKWTPISINKPLSITPQLKQSAEVFLIAQMGASPMVFSVLARFRLAFQDFDIHFPPEFCLGHLPFTHFLRIRVLNQHRYFSASHIPKLPKTFPMFHSRTTSKHSRQLQHHPENSKTFQKRIFSQKRQVQPLRVSLCISRWKKPGHHQLL